MFEKITVPPSLRNSLRVSRGQSIIMIMKIEGKSDFALRIGKKVINK